MEKIKRFLESDKGKDVLTVIIVILVGVSSFELGRLSKSGSSAGIRIEYTGTQEASAIEAMNVLKVPTELTPASTQTARTDGKNFFASSRGSKYYPVTCSAGKTIKVENRVYFATKAEAEKAGYELSSSCK